MTSRLDRNVDYSLLRSIRKVCGREIEEAVEGDPRRCAVLAALTANGSGGSAGARRFSPALYENLRQKLQGVRLPAVLASRRELERYLKKHGQGSERDGLRRLGSLYGYTLIPGYHCARWKIRLEELKDASSHFFHANRLIEDYRGKYRLDLEEDLARLGHLWAGEQGLGGTKTSMYVGRLRMRVDLYRRILEAGRRRAA